MNYTTHIMKAYYASSWLVQDLPILESQTPQNDGVMLVRLHDVM